MLVERIASSGLDPELFCIELTENASVANLGRAEALIRRLRLLGCGVALDDFGTGLSSLACLRQLPVSMLKIDGSFVRDVLVDPRAESMVRAIAQLAHSMQITTVAEYIETEAIGARIAELGVDYGQGFAIGRPIPLADLLLELPLPSAPEEVARAARAAAPDADDDEANWAAEAARGAARREPRDHGHDPSVERQLEEGAGVFGHVHAIAHAGYPDCGGGSRILRGAHQRCARRPLERYGEERPRPPGPARRAPLAGGEPLCRGLRAHQARIRGRGR
jgi:hypothetical protein